MKDPAVFIVRTLGFNYIKGWKVSPWHILALAIIDRFLLIILGREKQMSNISLDQKVVAVSKIDHLGDVLMMTPFLKELRTQVPTCRIVLVLGSWSSSLTKRFIEEGFCDAVTYYDPIRMNRSPRSRLGKIVQWIKSLLDARKFLQKEGVSVFIDLRSYSPNSLILARLSGIPCKVGYGLRGFSFLLQKELPYVPGKPIGQIYLDGLEHLDLKSASYLKPFLRLRSAGKDFRSSFSDSAVPTISVHPFSGNDKKMLADELWRNLCEKAGETCRVVVLGSEADSKKAAFIESLAVLKNVTIAVGQTTFSGALDTIEASIAFVGVDSVFAHAALAFDKPTFVVGKVGTSFRGAFPDDNHRLRYHEVSDQAAISIIPDFLHFLEELRS